MGDWIKYNGLTETEHRKVYSPQNGFQTVKVFVGTKGDIDNFASDLSNNKIPYVVRYRDPMEIEVTYDSKNDSLTPSTDNSNEDDNEYWVLSWDETSTPLKYHPIYIEGVSDETKDEIDLVDKELSERIDYKTETGKPLKNGELKLDRYTSNEAKNYFSKRILGIDSFTVYRPVLTQRIVTNNRSVTKASNDGVNEVATPEPIGNKLDSIVNQYEWIKLPASIRTVGTSKVEIEQSYLGANTWDANLYKGVAISGGGGGGEGGGEGE